MFPRLGLPHARGGVSTNPAEFPIFSLSSPRPWGCFHPGQRRRRVVGVFPTPVGVFPTDSGHANPSGRLPHARGGVSKMTIGRPAYSVSSPRQWGCSLIKPHPFTGKYVLDTSRRKKSGSGFRSDTPVVTDGTHIHYLKFDALTHSLQPRQVKQAARGVAHQ